VCGIGGWKWKSGRVEEWKMEVGILGNFFLISAA
jgi:hypothetical protein